MIVSNSAGATDDPYGQEAKLLEDATGVEVFRHSIKKPGCGLDVFNHLHGDSTTGIEHPGQIVVVGDRLFTDIMMANMIGAWSIWVKDGVVKNDGVVSDGDGLLGLRFLTLPSSRSWRRRCRVFGLDWVSKLQSLSYPVDRRPRYLRSLHEPVNSRSNCRRNAYAIILHLDDNVNQHNFVPAAVINSIQKSPISDQKSQVLICRPTNSRCNRIGASGAFAFVRPRNHKPGLVDQRRRSEGRIVIVCCQSTLCYQGQEDERLRTHGESQVVRIYHAYAPLAHQFSAQRGPAARLALAFP